MAVGSCGMCLADAKLSGGVEPAYTVCLGAAAFCRDLVRTQFRLQYKPVSRPGFSLRFRVLRAYQMTLEDDANDGSSEQEQSGAFDPPFDLIDVKARLSEPDGRDRFEFQGGYAYQHSDPNKADGYHTPYLSAQYYFGPPIRTGWGGLSRRWDVLLRVSQDRYAAAQRPQEELDQFVSTYTVPVTNDGATRVYAAYARELRFSGSNTVRTPSNRFEIGAKRYPTSWLELYGRISSFATRGIPGSTRFVAGANITI